MENESVENDSSVSIHLNPTALRKAKIAYNFGLSECNRVNIKMLHKSGDKNKSYSFRPALTCISSR